MTNDEILAILRQIESNNGQNFNHPLIQQGLNKGTHAIGNYGLTNAVVNDVAQKNPQLASLTQMDPDSKKVYLESHPDDESTIANQIVQHLQDRYAGDPNKIAYAWNHGTSLSPNSITPDKLQADDYTNKFQKLQNKLGMQSSQENPVQRNITQQTEPSGGVESGPAIDEDAVKQFLNKGDNLFNAASDENDDDENSLSNRLKQYSQL